MDWMQQSLDMMRSWSDMQKKMWQDWADAAAGLSKTAENPMGDWIGRWQDMMRQSMAVWEDFTRKMTEAQSSWAGSAPAWPGREEDVKKMMQVWSDQTAAMMKSWTEAQKTLWDNWFAMAGEMAKAAQGSASADWFSGWQKAAQESMDAWEKLSRQTMDAQADWLKTWTKTAASSESQPAPAAH